MRWLLIAYPWLELWSLIELGVRTSALAALLWVLAAAGLGVLTFRLVGRMSLDHLRQAQREGLLSAQMLRDDFALMVAGVLLLIPGLISDALAIILWIKPLRSLLQRLLVRGGPELDMSVDGRGRRQRGAGAGEEGVTVEGEYQQVGGQSLEGEKPNPLKQPEQP